MKQSIRIQLTRAFIAVAFVPVLLVGVVLAGLSFYTQRGQVLSREQTVAQSVAGQVEDFFKRIEGEISVVVKSLTISEEFSDATLLTQMPSYPDTIERLVVVSADGMERTHVDRLKVISSSDAINWSQQAAFRIPLDEGKIYYSTVTFDSQTGEPSVSISTPIFNLQTGRVNAVLVTSVRFKKIWDLIASIRVDAGEQLYVVDTTNRVIAHLNPSVPLSSRRFTPPAEPGIFNGLDNSSSVIATYSILLGGQNTRYTIVAEKNILVALEFGFITLGVTLALLIIGTLLAFVQGRYVAQRLTHPITELANAAEIIRAGTENFDPKTLEPIMARTDELGQLAGVFRNMGTQVKVREQELKQEVQKLKVEIDEAKKEKQVAEITDTEMFKDLKAKAAAMRARPKSSAMTPAEGTTS